MIPKSQDPGAIIVLNGEDETIDLSAGARARLEFLTGKYGNESAVIEAGIELLIKLDTNPNLSAGAKERLRILTKRFHGTDTAIIELALQHLLQKVLNSIQDRPPRTYRKKPQIDTCKTIYKGPRYPEGSNIRR